MRWLVLVILAGCKAREGEPCTLQSDCRGDLVCFCEKWGAYQCEGAGEKCTSVAKADAICAAKGNCRSDGECFVPRRSEMEGNSIAMCTARKDSCASLEVCRDSGKCTYARGLCVATRDSDCKKSDGCKNFGQCTLENEHCFAMSDADCASSLACTRDHRCKLKPEYNLCVSD